MREDSLLNPMIEDLFAITDFIDESRWISKDNYGLINFYKDDLSSDAQLLTHWICYITDRQIGFRRVWDVGGYIFSEIVDQLNTSRDLNLLNSTQPARSFFIKKQDYEYQAKYKQAFGSDTDDAKYIFVAKAKTGNNPVLR